MELLVRREALPRIPLSEKICLNLLHIPAERGRGRRQKEHPKMGQAGYLLRRMAQGDQPFQGMESQVKRKARHRLKQRLQAPVERGPIQEALRNCQVLRKLHRRSQHELKSSTRKSRAGSRTRKRANRLQSPI